MLLSAHRLYAASALALLSSTSALAASTVYVSSDSFLSHVAPASYFENFDGLADLPTGAIDFSGAGFSYAVSAPDNLFASGGFLSTNQIDQALTITFTGAKVTAVGANFYVVNLSDAFQSVSVTLTLSDGTTTSFTPTSTLDSYRGFTSNVGITSLVMSAPGVSLYAGIDNLTVGVSAVPEPASWALMGLGVAGLLAVRRRAA